MGCEEKQHQRCKKVYGKCVAYEGAIPNFSSLAEQECFNVEEVIEDLYSLMTDTVENIDVSTLDNDCLTFQQSLSIKSILQLLINTTCTQRDTINEMQGQISTMQEQISELQQNICN